jgi:nitrogen fixation/metabolism regulation signal transduction histidine kinase
MPTPSSLNKIVRTKMAFEDKLVKIALWGSAIPTLISFGFIAASGMSNYLKVLLIFLISVVVAYTAFAIRQHVIFQLRTSTNLVEAISSGDYSLRANNKNIAGALSDFNQLLNTLAAQLAQQSLITREKQILLAKVTDQIDVAIIATDENSAISLMNPAAERLFKKRFESIQGWPIKTLGLDSIMAKSVNKITEFELDQNKRKVYVRTDTYFELGKQHRLIFITDIQHMLRDEERQAWQKLLRVLSHEINNSLTPIASISETLSQVIMQEENRNKLDANARENLTEGLSVITERAHSLNHFIQDYQKLTHLPLPQKKLINLRPYLQSIRQLFEESNILLPDSDIEVFADSEQLQQVFVNLFKNAQEANDSKGGERVKQTQISWRRDDAMVHIEVIDEGAGINNQDNLFVPFYTTKKTGSGIGLTLSRQIALNHGGDLRLVNSIAPSNNKVLGAKAILSLPI